MSDLLRAILAPLHLSADHLRLEGADTLPSAFPVTELAAGSIGAACLALSELLGHIGPKPEVTVNRRLASLWFGWSIEPQGWAMPPAWDPIAGDYRTADGWIRLHTNAPHHRAAAIAVLRCPEDRAAVAAAVETWGAEALEQAVVDAGGCAAAMRTIAAWQAHPNGAAVATEPLIAFAAAEPSRTDWQPRGDRPLAGLKVLDLTRVLAGPVGTRFLAGYGADVLRIDPPGWDEANVIPEVTLGKRCARLDLRHPAHRATFERLLGQADILVHGYRADALDGLGYGAASRQALRPGLIDISLDAYGWTGPWHHRRGFDSLVQMSTGIAAAGMAWKPGADRPTPLPVQALDHATGYLIAAAAIRALTHRLRGEPTLVARLSLARTAALLIQAQGEAAPPAWSEATSADYAAATEHSDWGPAHRLRPPATISGAPMRWDRPATRLGSATPDW
jgi:hypothetical protein